jgi:hypothetical protein
VSTDAALAPAVGAAGRLRAAVEQYAGRPCVPTPSGRLALYLALRHWFTPGDELLMSPLTDDVVFFVVLAAGLRPVMAPLSQRDGNIDPAAIPAAAWSRAAGILTTNLYGLPDRVAAIRCMCRRHGVVLIEDACHALGTTVDGRRVGGYGDAAVFSLSKRLGLGVGGFLAVDDDDRVELERARDVLLRPHNVAADMYGVIKSALGRRIHGTFLARPILGVRNSLGIGERRRYRMELREGTLRAALQTVPGLDRFDAWVRVELAGYRRRPSRFLLDHMARRIGDGAGDDERRGCAVARLAAHPAAAPAVRDEPVQPLFRVPLLVEDRDAAVRALARRGLMCGYIYDPPLDEFAGPDLAPSCGGNDSARFWARHVLPVDPAWSARAAPVLARLMPVHAQ